MNAALQSAKRGALTGFGTGAATLLAFGSSLTVLTVKPAAASACSGVPNSTTATTR